MSEEAREMVVRAMEAFNARDRDAWLAICTDDFQMHSRFSSFTETIFSGATGVDAWWTDLSEAWKTMTLELHDQRALSSERVVVLFRLLGTGRESGVQVDERVAQEWTLRDGLIAEIDYLDRAEAERIVRGD